MAQMPRGVPVATVAINGARNAGLLAARIIGIGNDDVAKSVVEFQERLADEVRRKDAAMQQRLRT
jgi:5-(carboxyamino)imidazole ribonucleotide mutase